MHQEDQQHEPRRTPRWVHGLWLLFALLALAWLPLRSFNWDALAYLGCVAELGGASPTELHASVYAALDEHAEPQVAESLRSKNEYRQRCSSEPGAFADQLPFYRGRVLFLGLVAVLGWLGLSPVQALFLVAWLGGALLLVACGLWVRSLAWRAHSPSARRRLVVGTLLLLLALGVAFDVPASGTPDSLAAGLLVGGCYLLLEAGRPRLGLVLLGLSLATRVDSLVLVAPLLLWLLLRPSAARGGVPRPALTLAAMAFGAITLVGTEVRGVHGLWTVIFHTFVAYQAHPAETTPPLDLQRWLALVLRINYWFRWEAAAFVLAALVALGAGVRRRTGLGPAAGLALVALAGASSHFLLFPALWPRLMLPYWLLIAFAVAGAGAERD